METTPGWTRWPTPAGSAACRPPVPHVRGRRAIGGCGSGPSAIGRCATWCEG